MTNHGKDQDLVFMVFLVWMEYIDLARAKSEDPVNKFKLNQTVNL